MKTISTEWTPTERLEVVYAIALALRGDVQTYRRAEVDKTLDAAGKLIHVATSAAHFLESNRELILEGLQFI